MTTIDVRPLPPQPFPRTAPRNRLHQRLSGSAWQRLTTAVTVAVVVLSTVLAVVTALRAPAISPVAPPAAGGTVAPGPVTGLFDLLGGMMTGHDGPVGGGRRR